MDRERWEVINKIFGEVAEIKDPSRRAEYLARACDGSLRKDVESLLAHHESPDPFMGILSSMGGKYLLHYEILERIGEGGMGIVYKARDARLGRDVVLKVPPPWLMANTKATAILMEEARCASGLNHPNIVTVHGIERVNGVDFIVMEYVTGETLDRLIPPNGMAVSQAIGYGLQIASALAKAHAAFIIHRDVKPSNIKVTEEGLVKVLDFGLARVLESDTSRPDRQHGGAHELRLGTRDYMSPEQVVGLAADRRSDIFSFGVVLYEMLTGTRPFARRSQGILIGDEPPPILPDRLPKTLRDLVFRCLARDPEHRVQTIQDVLSELNTCRAFVSGSGVTPYFTPTSRRFAGLSALIALLILIAGFYFKGAPGSGSVAETYPVTASAAEKESISDRAGRLMREQKYAQAKALYDEVLKSDSANVRAHYNRAVCLQNLNRWREAVTDFSEVIQRNPSDSKELYKRALYNRAMCYMNLEMLREGLADLSEVIKLNPSRDVLHDAYSNRAKVRAALGDAAGAKDDERKALELAGKP